MCPVSLKYLQDFVILVSDGNSYVVKDPENENRPKGFDTGDVVFLDKEHIVALDSKLSKIIVDTENTEYAICKTEGCNQKATHGFPSRLYNPSACESHVIYGHVRIRCSKSGCEERVFFVVNGEPLCLGHVMHTALFKNTTLLDAEDPDVPFFKCPICSKRTKYGKNEKHLMCVSLSTILSQLTNIECRNVMHPMCEQCDGNPKVAYYKHNDTMKLYCISCAKKSSKEVWTKLNYTGQYCCSVCKKTKGDKKDKIRDVCVCNGCAQEYEKIHENATLVSLRSPCISGGREGCSLDAHYGFEKGRPLSCATHKKSEMFNVTTKRCKTCTILLGYKNATSIERKHNMCFTCRRDTGNVSFPRFKEFMFIEKLKHEISKLYSNIRFHENVYRESLVKQTKKYRPDLLVILGEHNVIIEVDENQHNERDVCSEKFRLSAICQLSEENGRYSKTSVCRINPDIHRNVFKHIPTRNEGIQLHKMHGVTLIDMIQNWCSGQSNEDIEHMIQYNVFESYISVIRDVFTWILQQPESVVVYFGYSDTSLHLPPADISLGDNSIDTISVRIYSLTEFLYDIPQVTM